MYNNFYICFDFDGTVVEHKYPLIGQLVPDSIVWLKKFQEYNIKVQLILYTMRSDMFNSEYLSDAIKFLNVNGLDNFKINNNPTQQLWTSSPKVYGNIYIDDYAIGVPLYIPEGFTSEVVDWSKVGPLVMKQLQKY